MYGQPNELAFSVTWTMEDGPQHPAAQRRSASTAKYRRIYAELREMLANNSSSFPAGKKLPSEHQLVVRFKASRPTIRRALAELQSEGLVQSRVGSGTFVNSKPENQGHMFGLLIPDLGITEIFEPICQGISRARLGSHHDLLWGPLFDPHAAKEHEAERLCDYLIRRQVSGVFFAPLELTLEREKTNQRIVEKLDQARIPIVLLDRDLCEYPQRSRYDLVGINNERAGYMVTEHLLLTGAKRVMFFARPGSAPTVRARLSGFRSALHSERGRHAEEMSILGDAGDASFISDMMARCKPDAIVCANDATAARLMTTLYTIGIRVPSEVKITGIDDIKYASMLQVPLTTIRQPCSEIGTTALMAMLDRVAHPNTPAREFLVDFQLCVRQSTGQNPPSATLAKNPAAWNDDGAPGASTDRR